jgi:hypothetical protein
MQSDLCQERINSLRARVSAIATQDATATIQSWVHGDGLEWLFRMSTESCRLADPASTEQSCVHLQNVKEIRLTATLPTGPIVH